MKKSIQLKTLLKEDYVLDMQTSVAMNKMKKMGFDKADRMISHFLESATLKQKMAYWKAQKEKNFERSARIVIKWFK